jgi:hypothetical protein
MVGAAVNDEPALVQAASASRGAPAQTARSKHATSPSSAATVGAGNPVRVVIDLLQPLIRRARWCGFGAGSAQRPGTGDVRAHNRFPLRRLAPSGIHARA